MLSVSLVVVAAHVTASSPNVPLPFALIERTSITLGIPHTPTSAWGILATGWFPFPPPGLLLFPPLSVGQPVIESAIIATVAIIPTNLILFIRIPLSFVRLAYRRKSNILQGIRPALPLQAPTAFLPFRFHRRWVVSRIGKQGFDLVLFFQQGFGGFQYSPLFHDGEGRKITSVIVETPFYFSHNRLILHNNNPNAIIIYCCGILSSPFLVL